MQFPCKRQGYERHYPMGSAEPDFDCKILIIAGDAPASPAIFPLETIVEIIVNV